MSINTGLDLKTRFALEKMKRIKISEISSVLVQFFLCAFLFFASDNFQGTFVDFRFMMFSLDELARILIYVQKIFKCRMLFKMLLSMCLVIVQKELGT